MKTKAVIEFTYPEDEDNLLFALKGPIMYKALTNIKMTVTGEFPHKADMAAVIVRVREITDHIFVEFGE